MGRNSLLVNQIIDSLDVLEDRCDELALRDLERLETEMSAALRFTVSGAIARKRIRFAYEGYAVNPLLPENFSSCPNEDRPESQRFWWNRPYIETVPFGDKTQFWVHCLDGGCWDRPTWWGEAETLDAAVEICWSGPSWNKPQ